MKSFQKYLEEVKYKELLNELNPKYKYYAYKDGKAETFSKKEDAQKYSSNIERFLSNKEELKQAKENVSKAWNTAVKNWETDLRDKYNYVSDEIYNVVYLRVYDEHHSNLDEMAEFMDDEIDFAYDIIKAYQRTI